MIMSPRSESKLPPILHYRMLSAREIFRKYGQKDYCDGFVSGFITGIAFTLSSYIIITFAI